MLVLKTLSLGPMHGYGIAQHLKRLSENFLQVEEGSLYPALQRMRQRGWIVAAWKLTPNKQRARYYTITARGLKQLGAEASSFDRMMAAISKVMQSA